LIWYQRRANKYGAKKTEYKGRVYDSKGEAGLAGEIDLLVGGGEVVKVEPKKLSSCLELMGDTLLETISKIGSE
jgi:hypothetical protein